MNGPSRVAQPSPPLERRSRPVHDNLTFPMPDTASSYLDLARVVTFLGLGHGFLAPGREGRHESV